MNSQEMIGIVAILYCIANLGAMGLELNLSETLKALRSFRLVTLSLFWCWIVSPALALLIIKFLPLSDAHAAGLLLFSLAPTAPMLPILIRKAKADMDYSGALMPLAVISTVIFMPIMVPRLIPGVTVSSFALAKQLVLSILMPLVVGILISVYAKKTSVFLFPYVKKLAIITTLLLIGFTVFIYGKELLSALGSFAIAAQIIFILIIGIAAYLLSFGMNQAQSSALSLGVCSRNGGAMFVAFTAFPVQDPNVLVMLLLAVPVPVIIWMLMAKYFASKADKLALAK